MTYKAVWKRNTSFFSVRGNTGWAESWNEQFVNSDLRWRTCCSDAFKPVLRCGWGSYRNSTVKVIHIKSICGCSCSSRYKICLNWNEWKIYDHTCTGMQEMAINFQAFWIKMIFLILPEKRAKIKNLLGTCIKRKKRHLWRPPSSVLLPYPHLSVRPCVRALARPSALISVCGLLSTAKPFVGLSLNSWQEYCANICRLSLSFVKIGSLTDINYLRVYSNQGTGNLQAVKWTITSFMTICAVKAAP
jgi:hypothetical protein